jgi:hypothetical protein
MKQAHVVMQLHPDQSYNGQGVYLCYGALHAQWVYATDINDAVRQSQTHDISRYITTLVADDGEVIIVTGEEYLKEISKNTTGHYWIEGANSTQGFTILGKVQQTYSREGVIAIFDELEISYDFKGLDKSYIIDIRHKYRL